MASGRFSQTEVFRDGDEGMLREMGTRRRTLESILLPYDAENSQETLTELKVRVQNPQQAQLLRDSVHLRDRYHIYEVAHYKSINVVMASIGFTREKKDPPEGAPGGVVPTTLMGYQDSYSPQGGSKSYLYALPAQTEAIEIKLDATAVLQWCIDSVGWENPGPEITSNIDTATEYLLNRSRALRVSPLEVIQETKQDALSDSAPFHPTTHNQSLLGWFN